MLSKLGSNLILFNQTLSVNLEDTLLPMQEAAKESRRITDMFELQEGVDRTLQLESLYSQSPVLAAPQGLIHQPRA